MCHYFLTLALLIARIINIFLNFHNKTIHKKQHWHKFQKFLRVTCDLKVTFFTLVISQQHVSKFQKYFNIYLFIFYIFQSIQSWDASCRDTTLLLVFINFTFYGRTGSILHNQAYNN